MSGNKTDSDLSRITCLLQKTLVNRDNMDVAMSRFLENIKVC